MSVLDVDTVDVVGIESSSGRALLIVSDHLGWDAVDHHLLLLQQKLNTYLAFVASGDLRAQRPHAVGEPVIRIEFECGYPDGCRDFLLAVASKAAAWGITLEVRIGLTGEPVRLG